MTRAVVYLLLCVLIAFGLWPYWTLFRLDSALAESSPQALAPYVDLPAIRESYRRRLSGTVEGLVPQDQRDGDQVIGWLATNLAKLGDAALDQAITLEWVRNALKTAAERAGDQRPALLIGSIDFAFFESWNRFVARVGPLGGETHVVLSLRWPVWQVTDLVH